MSIDGLDIRSCNRMDSVTKENTIDVSLDLSDHLGGLVLKEEQKLAVEALLSVKYVMAVLPTGFGKSIIYQSFVVAKNLAVSSSILVVVPLRSIIEDQLRFNDFGLKAVALEKNQQLLKVIGAFSFPSLSCYRSRRLKPQDSGIMIFLVEFVAAFLCCDEILLRYVDVFVDEVQSFCSISYFQCTLRANTQR